MKIIGHYNRLSMLAMICINLKTMDYPLGLCHRLSGTIMFSNCYAIVAL